jgi:hypothetical protein
MALPAFGDSLLDRVGITRWIGEGLSLRINVDTSDLLKWSRYMNRIPKKTGAAIARGLNTVGDNIVHNAAQAMAETTGLDPNDIIELIEVKKATADDLKWSMDASKVAPPSLDWSRPWDKRTGFDDRTLVKVVTSFDKLVCDRCLAVEKNSPYTLEEVNSMNPYGNGIVHPNCRCMVQAWYATRQLPVTFGRGAKSQLFTMRELGEKVAEELKLTIRAIDNS